jgi:hypothetical protein
MKQGRRLRLRFSRKIGLVLLLAGVVFTSSQTPSLSFRPDEITRLNLQIKLEGLDWQAGETSLTRLSPEERRRRLGGFVPLVEDPSRFVPIVPQAELPSSWNWADRQGKNYLTSVKNQGSCGSCWAFAALGLVEAVYNVEWDKYTLLSVRKTRGREGNQDGNLGPGSSSLAPGLIIQALNYPDLSEQELVSCSPAGNCDGGWAWKSLDYLQYNGVSPEDCFPYQAADVACLLCADYARRLTKINGWGWVTQATPQKEKIKAALLEAPLILYLDVYSDFYAYRSGVYQPTSSATYEGGHLVVLVGYDETKKCWICKNSWGKNWGEAGYFKIRMGSCNTGTWVLKAWGVSIGNRPPVLSPLDPMTIKEGEKLTVKLMAVDPDGDELTFGAEGLPQGASFDQRTGEFNWTPDYDQDGVYKIKFSVTDGLYIRYRQFVLTVINVKRTKGKY